MALTEELRREVEVCAARLWQLLEDGKLPPPIDGPKCLKCSLKEICQPRLSRCARHFNERTERDACGEEGAAMKQLQNVLYILTPWQLPVLPERGHRR